MREFENLRVWEHENSRWFHFSYERTTMVPIDASTNPTLANETPFARKSQVSITMHCCASMPNLVVVMMLTTLRWPTSTFWGHRFWSVARARTRHNVECMRGPSDATGSWVDQSDRMWPSDRVAGNGQSEPNGQMWTGTENLLYDIFSYF